MNYRSAGATAHRCTCCSLWSPDASCTSSASTCSGWSAGCRGKASLSSSESEPKMSRAAVCGLAEAITCQTMYCTEGLTERAQVPATSHTTGNDATLSLATTLSRAAGRPVSSSCELHEACMKPLSIDGTVSSRQQGVFLLAHLLLDPHRQQRRKGASTFPSGTTKCMQNFIATCISPKATAFQAGNSNRLTSR